MSIEIVSIGEEILLGAVVNTNAAYLGRRLNEEGYAVIRQMTLSDEPISLTEGLSESLKRSPIVLVTGGLGPTLDDNTLESAKKIFSTDPEQIPNPLGTAPGFIFEGRLFLLPGIPSEMEMMFEEIVIPYLRKNFPPQKFFREVLHFYSLNEKDLDPLLRQLKNVKIGIYPSYSHLTVILMSSDNSSVQRAKHTIIECFPGRLLPLPTLEESIQLWMKKHRKTLALAESCTGGYISKLLTAVPGCSDYFLGSLVTYSNKLKEEILGVSTLTLQTQGAVSRETVHEMWQGLKKKTKADFGIAVSGIAGPAGGSEDKPVGTIWYALGSQVPEIDTLHVKGNRKTVILRASKRILSRLYDKLSTDR